MDEQAQAGQQVPSITSSAASSIVSYFSSSGEAGEETAENGVIFYTAPEAEAFVDLNQARIRRIRNMGEDRRCGEDMHSGDTNGEDGTGGGGRGGNDEGESSSPSSVASRSPMQQMSNSHQSAASNQPQSTRTDAYQTSLQNSQLSSSVTTSAALDKQQGAKRLDWEPVEQDQIGGTCSHGQV